MRRLLEMLEVLRRRVGHAEVLEMQVRQNSNPSEVVLEVEVQQRVSLPGLLEMGLLELLKMGLPKLLKMGLLELQKMCLP